MNLARFTRIVVVVVPLLAVTHATSASASRSVDLSTLNPSPASLFSGENITSLTCQATGASTICQVTAGAPLSAPFPFAPCGSFDILASLGVTDRATLFYDPNGNLTRLVDHYSISGTLTNSSSVNGTALPVVEQATAVVTLTTPGDVSTSTTTFNGIGLKVVVPGSGVVFQDVGTITFGSSGIVKVGGPHPFGQYAVTGKPSAIAPLCSALSAPA